MLERFARWTLTDAWKEPFALASKPGSPRKGGSAQHIGNQGRLMAHVYALTRDPLYLAVPCKLAELGYGANAGPIFGTRSTGLVYNYLPWLLAASKAGGNPTPEEQLAVSAEHAPVALSPGTAARVRFVVTNKGGQPVDDLSVAFHTRLDFAVATVQPPPTRLLPGQTVECVYEIRAPAQVNLSCDYNEVAFAHWSALYRRSGSAHLAHLPVKLTLK